MARSGRRCRAARACLQAPPRLEPSGRPHRQAPPRAAAASSSTAGAATAHTSWAAHRGAVRAAPMPRRLRAMPAHVCKRIPVWDPRRADDCSGGMAGASMRCALAGCGSAGLLRTAVSTFLAGACLHVVSCSVRVHSSLSGLGAECARVSAGPRALLVSPRGICACLPGVSL